MQNQNSNKITDVYAIVTNRIIEHLEKVWFHGTKHGRKQVCQRI